MLKKIATFTINVGTAIVIGHTGSAKYKRLQNCVFLGTAVRRLDRIALCQTYTKCYKSKERYKNGKIYWKSYDLHVRKRMGI